MTYTDSARGVAVRLAPERHAVSQLRHGEGSIRTFGLDAGPTVLVPPQPAGYAHLVALRSGVAKLQTQGAWTFLTRERGVWVPAGHAYALALATYCRLRIAYVPQTLVAARSFGPVVMNELLHELIERATVSGFLDPNEPRDARLLAVIADELARLSDGPQAYSLVLPRDAALRSAIDRWSARCADGATVADLAAAVGSSVRTLERRFKRETGLAPGEWLRRARLNAATVALASGTPVTEAALDCGYSSLSAFVAAYRSLFGVTPGSVGRFRGRAPV